MKTIYTLLFLFISNSLFAQQYYQVTTEVLNVRNSASKNSEVISKLNLGDSVYVTDYSNDWSKVNLSDGNYGYVSSKYISKDFITYEQPDTKNEEKKSVWGTLAVLAFICLAWFFKGSSKGSSSSSSNKSIPKSKPMFWFMCRNCGTTVKQGSQPSSSGCPTSHKFHHWNKLSEVGETNYQCRNCGTSVYAKSNPSSSGCPTDKKFHHWTRL